MASRRAHADEYALRLNRAVVLLGERSPAAVGRALQSEHGLSERQARRYVRAAQRSPDGVMVPERTVVFTVRLPVSLVERVRAVAAGGAISLSATVADALVRGLAGSKRDGGTAR
jgi:hypothetical protein